MSIQTEDLNTMEDIVVTDNSFSHLLLYKKKKHYFCYCPLKFLYLLIKYIYIVSK
jgi:hypothetical protein